MMRDSVEQPADRLLQPGRHERLTGGKPSHKSIDQGK
jgi:hypothetical protein